MKSGLNEPIFYGDFEFQQFTFSKACHFSEIEKKCKFIQEFTNKIHQRSRDFPKKCLTSSQKIEKLKHLETEFVKIPLV